MENAWKYDALTKEQLEELLDMALYSVADLVNQFAYETTFRRKDAVADGGLSALEYAFNTLWMGGVKLNSNGTITREYLWKFMEEHYRRFCIY